MAEESFKDEYTIENIAKIMSEESFGVHISLLDRGTDPKTGKPLVGVSVESNLNAKTVKNLLQGIVEQYEEKE